MSFICFSSVSRFTRPPAFRMTVIWSTFFFRGAPKSLFFEFKFKLLLHPALTHIRLLLSSVLFSLSRVSCDVSSEEVAGKKPACRQQHTHLKNFGEKGWDVHIGAYSRDAPPSAFSSNPDDVGSHARTICGLPRVPLHFVSRFLDFVVHDIFAIPFFFSLSVFFFSTQFPIP